MSHMLHTSFNVLRFAPRCAALLALTLAASCAAPQATPVVQPPASKPASQGAAGAPTPAKRSFNVESRSTGTRRESEPPRYVRNLEKTDWFRGDGLDWLDVGLDYRLRYEYRDDDLRRPVATLDQPFLLRTRGYLGVRQRFDPFRGYIEYEDARRVESQFPEDDRDFNRHELIQAVAELYLADALEKDRPVRLQAGRFAFEYVDRRLIARNEWRNTTNNFQGFRAILGQPSNDWQVDVLALKPVQRLLTQLDESVANQWFYGVLGEWRRWSEVVTLQPYYLLLKQQRDGAAVDRDIHTVGLRGYGARGTTGLDYDAQGIVQFGDSGTEEHSAFAATAELGYSFDHAWKPRAAAFMGYASGDDRPGDGKSGRFERLFGFARPWSNDDYIQFENVVAPKVRLEFQPHQRVRVDLGWNWYWLASETDRWNAVRLQDPTGQSGDFMGHEFDVRARVAVLDRIDLTIGYAHFWPGEFTENLGRPQDSDFLYIEISPRLLP